MGFLEERLSLDAALSFIEHNRLARCHRGDSLVSSGRDNNRYQLPHVCLDCLPRRHRIHFPALRDPMPGDIPRVPVAADSLGKKLWPDGISLRPHSEDEGRSDVSQAGRDRGNRLDSGILPRTTSSELTPFRGAARIKIGY